MHQGREAVKITIENSPNAGRVINYTEEQKMGEKAEEPDEEQLRTLWVGSISEKVDEELLFELFINAGPLQRVIIPKDRETKKPRAYGFIVFHHPESVPYAFELLNGTELFGQRIRLQNKATGLGLGVNGRPMAAGGGSYGGGIQPPRGPHVRSHTLPATTTNNSGGWQPPPPPPDQMSHHYGMNPYQQQQPPIMMMMGGGFVTNHYQHPAEMMMMGGQNHYYQHQQASNGHDDRRGGGQRYSDSDRDHRHQRDARQDFSRDHDVRFTPEDNRRHSGGGSSRFNGGGGREPPPPGDHHSRSSGSDYRDRSHDRRGSSGRDSRDYYGRR